MAEMTAADIIDNADSFAYCPNCQVKVAPCRITFEELHDSCGHTILWIDDATPIVAMQALIEQQAQAIERLRLYRGCLGCRFNDLGIINNYLCHGKNCVDFNKWQGKDGE